MTRYAVVLTSPDGTMMAYGPLGKAKTDKIVEQLQDVSPWYSGPIGGPEFDIATVVVEQWPGIRAFKKEIQ